MGVEEGCAVKGLWKPEESELFTHPCAGSRANAHDAGGAERVELEADDARVEVEADDARQWLSGALYHFDAPPLPRLRRSLVSLRAPPLRGRRAALPMAS